MADAFQPKFVDLVRNTTTTQGTGNFTLGAAVSGFASFTAALQPGDSFYYSAIGVDKPQEREVGRGTLQANGSVSRNPISGTLTNFSSGTKTIAVIAAAEWYDAAQQLVATASRIPAVLADRAALAGYSATGTAYLGEAGREGMFVWDGSNLAAHVSADIRQGLYVAGAGDPSGAAGAWVRKYPGGVNARWFGATGDGVTDDSAAFVAAIAALKAHALNTGGSGFYKGSPKLFVPAGHYYLGSTPIDINHTLTIEGEGSGRAGPQAFGCTRLRWDGTVSGIRTQHTSTSGDTTVDGPHDGTGGATLRGLMLDGDYSGTEGEHHGLVVRGITFCDDLYIKNWPGEGVKGWTGTVNGTGYGGNISTSRFFGVKTEGCRGGFDFQGTDSNVLTLINCESYQNRQFGIYDNNGAGSNTYIGHHAASCGVCGSIPTQCTYSGNHYAAKWGGTFTNAPSGTATDTADWLFIEAGGVDSTRPAHTTTPNSFRAGGDYVTTNSGVELLNCYSEGGAFSQFGNLTVIRGGTITDQYYRGGTRIRPDTGGLVVKSSGANSFYLDSWLGVENTIFARYGTGVTTYAYIDFQPANGNTYKSATDHNFLSGASLVGTLNTAGLNLSPGEAYRIAGTQVVGARQAGTPADATDLASALTLVNSLKAKLIAHGLIA